MFLPCVNNSDDNDDDDDDDDDDDGAGEGGGGGEREKFAKFCPQPHLHKTLTTKRTKKKTTLASNSVNKPLDRRS